MNIIVLDYSTATVHTFSRITDKTLFSDSEKMKEWLTEQGFKLSEINYMSLETAIETINH